MRPLPPVLVFDLDGTLIDSAPALHAALNDVLQRLGRRPISASELRGMLGDRLHGLVARALAATGAPLPVGPILAELRAHYDRHSTRGLRVFDGVETTLTTLGRRYRLALCTNKPRPATDQVLAHLGWGHHFEAVAAWGDVPEGKPHPALLHRLMDVLAVPAAQMVLIGDTANDAGAAQAAGVRFIAVDYGYAHHPVGTWGAERVIAGLGGLLE